MRFIALIVLIIAMVTITTPKNHKRPLSKEWNNVAFIQDDIHLDSTDCSAKVINYNLAKLLTKDQGYRLGFIGMNYQRFFIHFSSVVRDSKDKRIYIVHGKTRVKNNVCDFVGSMKLIGARQFHDPDECENTVRPKTQGVILFKYIFQENPKQSYSGVLEGYGTTRYYIDSLARIQYDDLGIQCEDGFANNSFVGVWKSYSKGETKTCNWGDCRIPCSGDLDNGAGEFYPSSSYEKFGWDKYGVADTIKWWK